MQGVQGKVDSRAMREINRSIIEAARESMSKHTLRGGGVRIVPGALGDRVGLVGALLSAMDQSVRSYRVVATSERVALG